MFLKTLYENTLKSQLCLTSFVRTNCYRASINTNKRPVYARMYPVRMVKPDGSSITIMYHEPISILKLPFDLNTLDEAERKRRMLKRQMFGKSHQTENTQKEKLIDTSVKFDPKKYLNLTNKKK